MNKYLFAFLLSASGGLLIGIATSVLLSIIIKRVSMSRKEKNRAMKRSTEGSVSTISNLWTNSLHRHHPLTSDWYRNTSLEGAPESTSSSLSQVRLAAFPAGQPHRNVALCRANLAPCRSSPALSTPTGADTATTTRTTTTTLSSSSSSSRLHRCSAVRPVYQASLRDSAIDNLDSAYCHTLKPALVEVHKKKLGGANAVGL